MKQCLRACVLSGLVLLATVLPTFAQTLDTAVLSWTANTEADLAGYKVYQSTVSGSYGAPVSTIGKVSTFTVTLPARVVSGAQTFYFTLTAYDTAGNESVKSIQVSKTIPAAINLPPAAPVGVTVQ